MRVGGGPNYPVAGGVPAEGLSPRGRGTPESSAGKGLSIPAWAGEPEAVWKRQGGLHFVDTEKWGLGIPVVSIFCSWRKTLPRSIPAWAGEPVAWSPTARFKPVYPRVGGGPVLA